MRYTIANAYSSSATHPQTDGVPSHYTAVVMKTGVFTIAIHQGQTPVFIQSKV